MLSTSLRGLLLAGSGLALMSAGPAFAQQSQECAQQLDQIEQQMAQADLSEDRQNDIQQIVDGARTLSDTGDTEGCMRVVAELQDLMQTLDESSQAAAQTGQQQQTGDQAQTGSFENLQEIHYLRCGQPSGRFWTIVDYHTSESAAEDAVAAIRDAHSAEAEVWRPASGNYYWVVMAACVSEEEAKGIEKYAEERGIASDARVIVYF